MNYRLMIRPEADADLRHAQAWYEEQQPGLGTQFIRAVRAALIELARNPLGYRVRSHRRQVRWLYPRRFPYRIVYRVTGATIIVYAIIHASRRDKNWKNRI